MTRIAVVGPESSGKTTLCQEIAGLLTGRDVTFRLVPEQGRLLAEHLPPAYPWSYREQVATAKLHMGALAMAECDLRAGSGGVVICDGTELTPLVWHRDAVLTRPHYDAGPDETAEQLLGWSQAQDYDLTILTAPDVPWEADGVREDPGGRERVFGLYRELLDGTEYLTVAGSGTSRGRTALQRIEEMVT